MSADVTESFSLSATMLRARGRRGSVCGGGSGVVFGGCSRATVAKWLPTMSIFTVAVIFGVHVNYYGQLFQPVRVQLQVSAADATNSSLTLLRLGRQLTPALNNNIFYVVPNIVHFIWFSKKDDRQLTFLNYISIRSAHQIQKPDQIMFHCNTLPVGYWWDRLWSEISLTIVHRDPPEYIHGQRIYHMYHSGDIAKMEVLIKYGGMYLDYDVIVVNSLDPLRRYDATLGKEKPPKFIAGIIVARQGSTFLRLLYESYRGNYRPWDWDYNCARVAYGLYIQRPDLLHVEPYRLTTPDWQDRRKLWNDVIDWSDLYVIHVMGHFNWIEYTPQNIRMINRYSGADMTNLCREASMAPIRDLSMEDIRSIPDNEVDYLNCLYNIAIMPS